MTLVNPDDFDGDSYGYWTNQGGHTFDVGFLLFVYSFCVGFVWHTGDAPYKETIIITAGVLYFLFEMFTQGWKGWDTVEDWWFVNVYGVVAPVLSFNHTGGYDFTVNLLHVFPFVIMYYAHKVAGSIKRCIDGKV